MGTNTMISIAKRTAVMLVALAGFAVAGSAVATAQEELAPEHLALARQYVDLTDKSGIYEVALVQAAANTFDTIKRTNPEIVGELDTAITKALEVWKAKKGELMDQFARNYALVFSPDELQEIVNFYGSPTGQKLAAANSSINESQQMVMQVFQANLRTEFFALVRAELKALGKDV
jgi:hypothetical protein